MSTKVLLSIKPEFADAIFSGKKKYEYRKAKFKKENIVKVFVYSSSPVCKVIGEFVPSSIISSTPKELWTSTKRHSGISKLYFDEYFGDRALGHAIKVGSFKRYSFPKSLKDMFDISRPPQSFQYV